MEWLKNAVLGILCCYSVYNKCCNIISTWSVGHIVVVNVGTSLHCWGIAILCFFKIEGSGRFVESSLWARCLLWVFINVMVDSPLRKVKEIWVIQKGAYWTLVVSYLHWYVQTGCPMLISQHSKLFWIFWYHINKIPDCTCQCRINQLIQTKWSQAVALSWYSFCIILLGYHCVLIIFL